MNYTTTEKYEHIKTDLLNITDKDPIGIVKHIMKNDYINIHGPEHHFLDGAALMAAMKNDGLNFDLSAGLDQLAERTIKMPEAMCGYWGICGSVASIGAVFSILDSTGPLSNDQTYADHMDFTSQVISRMSKIGGPRCCKRNAFISISQGILYANQHYGLSLPVTEITCEFSSRNQQCLHEKCPFYKK